MYFCCSSNATLCRNRILRQYMIIASYVCHHVCHVFIYFSVLSTHNTWTTRINMNINYWYFISLSLCQDYNFFFHFSFAVVVGHSNTINYRSLVPSWYSINNLFFKLLMHVLSTHLVRCVNNWMTFFWISFNPSQCTFLLYCNELNHLLLMLFCANEKNPKKHAPQTK